MIIRDDIPSDRQGVFDVVTAAFGQTLEAELVEALKGAGDIVVSLIAELDRQVIGHIALSKMEAPFSALAPSRAEASARFLGWLERVDTAGRLFLSVIAIHDIEKGIALLEHKGATAKAAGLKAWLAGLIATYDDKILPLDALAAALAGQLEAKAIAAGHDPGMANAAVAGIAKARDLVVITHNTKQFLPFGVYFDTPDEVFQLN
jgi:predicted nucleic acid-binding protein